MRPPEKHLRSLGPLSSTRDRSFGFRHRLCRLGRFGAALASWDNETARLLSRSMFFGLRRVDACTNRGSWSSQRTDLCMIAPSQTCSEN